MWAERRALATTCLVALLAAGCTGQPVYDSGPGAGRESVDYNRIPDAVPRIEPRSRYGNPPSYTVFGKSYHVLEESGGFVERGIASWYGTKFHGRRTSNGETYDMYGMSAAHKTLPLPTYVRVTNLLTQESVVVRVNDRGPFHDDRIIDLSYAAAKKLNIVGHGTAVVEVRAIDPRAPEPQVVNAGGEQTQAARPAILAAAAPLQEPEPLPQPVRLAAADPMLPATATSYLQVGAFRSQSNAEALRLRLAELMPAAVQTDAETSPPIYRVRVGPFTSTEAKAAVERLAEMGFGQARLVAD